jgi:GNAT superfamily N-acetyltransferase
MKDIMLRQAQPDRDFSQLAAWFTSFEDEPSTETGLKDWYAGNSLRAEVKVAENETGDLLGFYWATRSKTVASLVNFDLFVASEHRRQGVGTALEQEMMIALKADPVKVLRVNVLEDCLEGLDFVNKRGFTVRSHRLLMALDLERFDDSAYDPLIARLEGEGFQFTSMEALGNTVEAQRKLYALNESTGMDVLGSTGERTWTSFEDFQNRVCLSGWYKPGGQMVVIDTTTGDWAAMSAITCMDGNEYANTLHTGTDRRYRGRKLAQAVKVIALRYARRELKARQVRTYHNSKNLPMLAIDRKFGYRQMGGNYMMEKVMD